MARPKKRKREQQRRLHQEPIVREVARLLDTGTPTKFRWESACRQGLRSAMCLKGMKWDVADDRAGRIVTLALHRIGSGLRPSWQMGQPEPRQREYYFCQTCGGRLDAENSGRPWCSDTCRNTVMLRERYQGERLEDAARRKATRVILTGGSERVRFERVERRCHHCETLFTPSNPQRRFCSRLCSARAGKFKPRDCLICAKPFSPNKEDSHLYCGEKCATEAYNRQRRQLWASRAKVNTLTCKVCAQPFTSTRSRTVTCSEVCHAEHDRRRARVRSLAWRARKREELAAQTTLGDGAVEMKRAA